MKLLTYIKPLSVKPAGDFACCCHTVDKGQEEAKCLWALLFPITVAYDTNTVVTVFFPVPSFDFFFNSSFIVIELFPIIIF